MFDRVSGLDWIECFIGLPFVGMVLNDCLLVFSSLLKKLWGLTKGVLRR